MRKTKSSPSLNNESNNGHEIIELQSIPCPSMLCTSAPTLLQSTIPQPEIIELLQRILSSTELCPETHYTQILQDKHNIAIVATDTDSFKEEIRKKIAELVPKQ